MGKPNATAKIAITPAPLRAVLQTAMRTMGPDSAAEFFGVARETFLRGVAGCGVRIATIAQFRERAAELPARDGPGQPEPEPCAA